MPACRWGSAWRFWPGNRETSSFRKCWSAQDLRSRAGRRLPLPTRIVIGLSNFVASYFGLAIFFGVIALIVGIKIWYGTPQGRYILDAGLLKAPLIGLLLRKIAVARFTRTLGTLISSGVPILEGLDITAKTAGNAVVERALLKVRKALQAGTSLTH